MFRAYYLTFHGEFRGTEEQKSHLHESPLNMTLPLMVLAVLSIVGGFINLPHFIGHGEYANLDHWLSNLYVYDLTLAEVPLMTEMILLGLTILMFFVVWFVVKNIYVNKKKMALPEESYTGWEKLSNKKLFIDELNNATFVKFIEGLGVAGNMFDKGVLKRFVDYIGTGAEDSGRAAKKLQNGNVENYVLIMSLAIGIILIVNFILQ
jgi:NADH-quinone oxidoreductase subunit L